MAITINTEILTQEATSTFTYCYLYEPLRVSITENDGLASKIYIDLQVINTLGLTVFETKVEYAEFDIFPGTPISVDLMKIAQQYHNANVFKYADVGDIANDDEGWKSVVSEFRYNFRIYSDVTGIGTADIKKLPIIGQRDYEDFVGVVPIGQSLTEFELYSETSYDSKWKLWPKIETVLVSPENVDARPLISVTTNAEGDPACGGYLIWKSRLGGWMYWGFDFQSKGTSKTFGQMLDVGMFESTDEEGGGKPFVPVNYTGITNAKSYTIKALSLTSNELLAVAGIQTSPAVYFVHSVVGDLELMRVGSVSAPNKNEAAGGDFQVSLTSISKTGMSVR